jgi:hypothetical protein
MEGELRIRNGKNPASAGIRYDNRSLFSLHQVGDESLETIRRTQVLRASEGDQNEGETCSDFAGLQYLGNAPHRH